ncbi:NADH-quinone oxidoreductase subunit N [Geobacter argillaceus]|uniref:NADH-quinone oxidoreductase subunit N n=1 Tax=Geobacter argillaceus TaxID=345631 RepID=A0A562VLT0_9BACT|nr:NADH-quinone oxidoreductase subunit N [Geobacter argillaceus]TWJ18879.1 NADH dehydrogenase subunit N [Geobacter argillaceus]
MTIADLWILMPLLLLAGGSLLILLLGAIVPGRYTTTVGVAVTLGAALWAVQSPPALLAPNLGLAATPFARFFTIFFSLTTATVLVLADRYNSRHGIAGEEFPATMLFAAFGMVTLSASVNFLTFFLGLEALTFAFYILVAIDLNRPASAEAGLKYLLLGAVAAAFIAFGIALIYTGSGSLAIDTAMRAAAGDNLLVRSGWGIMLIGLAFKASLVPAHLWTPDVYQGAPTPVTAFLAAASKGAAVVALLLLLTRLDTADFLRIPLGGLALLSMVVGNLAALRQENVKRLLAYSSIGQMGYVALALLAGKSGGYEASAFYAVAYGAMTITAFGALTVLDEGGSVERVDDLRGMGYKSPFAAGVLALALFSLAGIPPTAGFTGKFLIFAAVLRAGEFGLAVAGMLTAAVSVYFYLRVVVSLYLQPRNDSFTVPAATATESTVLALVSSLIVLLGVLPGGMLELAAKILR